MTFDFKNVKISGGTYAELISKWLPGELEEIKRSRAEYDENAKKPRPRHILPKWLRSLIGFDDFYGSIEWKHEKLRNKEREFDEYRRRMDFARKNPTAIFTLDRYALDWIDAMPYPGRADV